VDVIFNAADGQCLHAIVPSDAAHIRPKTQSQVLRDEEATAFRAEDTMKQAAGKGMAHNEFSTG